eukprot:CAMPEP_0173372430 /NCGR_PEP_ID=MMETSP1144-20121109/27877_1 /TAXON_ID=483371 /ORGANISM="non described non described, Strain CCMP2298" /LENGTH=202 /DNA_ID=CAMNT_0014324371 /DNA_START=1 /DNA_END=610 /DNA_ORIENTATION=+
MLALPSQSTPPPSDSRTANHTPDSAKTPTAPMDEYPLCDLYLLVARNECVFVDHFGSGRGEVSVMRAIGSNALVGERASLHERMLALRHLLADDVEPLLHLEYLLVDPCHAVVDGVELPPVVQVHRGLDVRLCVPAGVFYTPSICMYFALNESSRCAISSSVLDPSSDNLSTAKVNFDIPSSSKDAMSILEGGAAGNALSRC